MRSQGYCNSRPVITWKLHDSSIAVFMSSRFKRDALKILSEAEGIGRLLRLCTACFDEDRAHQSHCNNHTKQWTRFHSNHGYQSGLGLLDVLFELENDVDLSCWTKWFTNQVVAHKILRLFGLSLGLEIWHIYDNTLSTTTLPSHSPTSFATEPVNFPSSIKLHQLLHKQHYPSTTSSPFHLHHTSIWET